MPVLLNKDDLLVVIERQHPDGSGMHHHISSDRLVRTQVDAVSDDLPLVPSVMVTSRDVTGLAPGCQRLLRRVRSRGGDAIQHWCRRTPSSESAPARACALPQPRPARQTADVHAWDESETRDAPAWRRSTG